MSIFSYTKWADQYDADAERLTPVINDLNKQRKSKRLTADQKKTLDDKVIAYREIRRNLREIATKLRKYAARYE